MDGQLSVDLFVSARNDERQTEVSRLEIPQFVFLFVLMCRCYLHLRVDSSFLCSITNTDTFYTMITSFQKNFTGKSVLFSSAHDL